MFKTPHGKESTEVRITQKKGKEKIEEISRGKTHTNTRKLNSLREKFLPGPGFEPGSPALHAGALTKWGSNKRKILVLPSGSPVWLSWLERQRTELETQVRILVQARIFLLNY